LVNDGRVAHQPKNESLTARADEQRRIRTDENESVKKWRPKDKAGGETPQGISWFFALHLFG